MTLTSLLAAAVSTYVFGLYHPERLETRGAGALLFAGFFGIVVGTMLFRFWRLNEKSGHFFRWATDTTLWEGEGHFLGTERFRIALGQNRGDAFDFGPRVQYVICVTIAFVLAVASIDARALDLLGRFGTSMASPSSSYCPEPESETVVHDVNAPGCELIRRAYALGYAKSLGDCGAKTTKKATTVCTLRQRDEPFAHYAWRLLTKFGSEVQHYGGRSYFEKLRHDFDRRVEKLDTFQHAQKQVLASAPHSSHHIWTNLPDPGDGAFREETCADRYRSLTHRPSAEPGDKRASKVFEHIAGQLLFESRYEPSAAYCREFRVHWGASPEICRRLIANPEAVLTESGVIEHVRAVLMRHRIGGELEALAEKKTQPATRKRTPPETISFHCYIEGPESGRTSTPFAFDGFEFSVEQMRVPPSPPAATLFIDRYHAIAALFVRGFHYGALMSEAGLTSEGQEGLEPSFSGKDFMLSRLYGLESLDLYLDPGWIAGRPDLLEVYPYQVHLKNYVAIFRRQYRRERGRL